MKWALPRVPRDMATNEISSRQLLVLTGTVHVPSGRRAPGGHGGHALHDGPGFQDTAPTPACKSWDVSYPAAQKKQSPQAGRLILEP